MKRWYRLGVVFASIALLVAMLAISACAGGAKQPSQPESGFVSHVGWLLTIESARFCGSRPGLHDPRTEESWDFFFVWYSSDAKEGIAAIGALTREELWELDADGLKAIGAVEYYITDVDERQLEGIYQYFQNGQYVGEWFETLIIRVTAVEEGRPFVRGTLKEIGRDNRSWNPNDQRFLDEISELTAYLSKNSLWRKVSYADAFAQHLKFAKDSLFEGYGTRVAEEHMRRAMEYLFQDAFSGSWVEAELVGPSDYCSRGSDGKDGECWIRGRIEDSELQLGLIADPALRGRATVSLRHLPDAIKELIRKVEVLTLADSEFDVTWGRTSWLGFQDKFGNWYVLVPGE